MDHKNKPQSHQEKTFEMASISILQVKSYEKKEKKSKCKKKAAKLEYVKIQLSENIKTNNKAFWNYVQSKTKARKSVGNLVDNSGVTITKGAKKAAVLNEFFTSVFTKEKTPTCQLYIWR